MKARVKYDFWLFKLPGMGRWDGVTIYPWILLRPSRKIVTDRLLRHEYQHILQVRQEGWFKFYLKYIWYNIKYGYFKNPYEVDARRWQYEPFTEMQREELGLP